MQGQKRDVSEVLAELGASGEPFSSSDVAAATGLTRQAVHAHLRRAIDAGDLLAAGKGRGARYRGARPRGFEAQLPTLGLAEDRVWAQVRAALPQLARPEHAAAAAIGGYAFTEMLNNVLDHSGSSTVDVRATDHGGRFRFELKDAGVGAFEHVRAGLNLPDALTALQEISKGKTTTAPERHTGEGIFFTSKAADRFELAANGILWLVDNLRGDQAVGSAPVAAGTRVQFEVALDTRARLDDLFARYTHDFEFDTTRTVVKLFSFGVRFVSRSEAKRLLRNLERFRHVILDFAGVEAVGQGFADEVFRVWAADHPEVELTAENMSPPVAFMVHRARGGSSG